MSLLLALVFAPPQEEEVMYWGGWVESYRKRKEEAKQRKKKRRDDFYEEIVIGKGVPVKRSYSNVAQLEEMNRVIETLQDEQLKLQRIEQAKYMDALIFLNVACMAAIKRRDDMIEQDIVFISAMLA